MSKIIFACFKRTESNASLKEAIEKIAERLIPDNISALPPTIVEENNIVYGIVNPVRVVEINGSSVMVGKIFGNESQWWIPGQQYPDGSYALFRGSEDAIELVSDVAGSRSIWYYKDETRFIASTSQRAIIGLLKSFSFNKAVLPWILSTGGLGPSQSWDTRIKLLPPDSSIILDRRKWTLTTKSNRIEFSPLNVPDKKHKELLRDALEDTFQSLNLDYRDWVLPLSGGYDSRSILCFLNKLGKGIDKLKTITWGLKSSLKEKDNDAYIAVKLAERFKVEHKYYPTDLSEEPAEELFNRYLICGEGRIDHIGGYLDGFEIWKTLFEDNIQGIIRGDIGFSSVPADSQFAVRKRLGLSLCADYSNLKDYERFGFLKQEMPEYLLRREGETLDMWRDRLYHEYRMPTILAALSDLKLSYVEIVNPLLSRRIIYQIRQLSDHLRNNKSLFKSIAESISPSIPYAKSGANANVRDILKSEAIIDLFKKVLSSDMAKSVFPEDFISYVLSNVKIGDIKQKEKNSFKYYLKRYMPKWLKNKLLNSPIKTSLNFNLIAFRMYIACQMYNLLTIDADSKPFPTHESSKLNVLPNVKSNLY